MRAGRDPRSLRGWPAVDELRRGSPSRSRPYRAPAADVSSIRRRFVGGSPLKSVIVPSTPQMRPMSEPKSSVIMPRWVIEKGDVMLLPRPARKRGDGEIRRPSSKQPDIEPRRAIDVGPRHLRVEARFVDRARDAGDDQHRQQHHRQLERGEELERRNYAASSDGRTEWSPWAGNVRRKTHPFNSGIRAARGHRPRLQLPRPAQRETLSSSNSATSCAAASRNRSHPPSSGGACRLSRCPAPRRRNLRSGGGHF